MTPQEAFDFHRQRAFRDPDGEVDELLFDDPIEVMAEMMQLVRWETPAGALSIMQSPNDRAAVSKRWVAYGPEKRRLYRNRAAVALVAAGVVAES